MAQHTTDVGTLDQALRQARQAARAHSEAAERVTRFLDQLAGPAQPADVAEYANLIAQEEAARRDRVAALEAVGLTVPSVEDDTR